MLKLKEYFPTEKLFSKNAFRCSFLSTFLVRFISELNDKMAVTLNFYMGLKYLARVLCSLYFSKCESIDFHLY